MAQDGAGSSRDAIHIATLIMTGLGALALTLIGIFLNGIHEDIAGLRNEIKVVTATANEADGRSKENTTGLGDARTAIDANRKALNRLRGKHNELAEAVTHLAQREGAPSALRSSRPNVAPHVPSDPTFRYFDDQEP